MSRIPQTRDAQALNFGVQSTTSAACPQAAGALSAVATGPPTTATTDFTAANANNLAGCIVFATTTSATWAAANVVYATVLSNGSGSNSQLVVDGWRKVSDDTVASNPFATSQYVVFPAQAPFKIFALSDSVAAVAGTETGTAMGGTEWVVGTAPGLQRAYATTFTHTAGASTGTIGKTFTYTGSSSVTVGRSALVNSLTAGGTSPRGNFAFFIDRLNGGTGYALATSGDTLQILMTVTYATVP